MALSGVVLCLAATVVIAHSALDLDHGDKGAVICVAVAASAAVVLASRVMSTAVLRPWTPALGRIAVEPAVVLAGGATPPGARAGPAVLQVFLR